jgi:epidermal growth factor receptor substrate 15
MKLKVVLCAFIILAFAGAGSVAFADAASVSGGSMSLVSARELALSRSKPLKQAMLAVDASLLEEKSDRYGLLPDASIAVKGAFDYAGAASLSLADTAAVSATLSVSQTLYDGGANAIILAIDKLATKSARQEARAAYFSALLAIDQAYYGVLEAQAALDAAESDLAASKAHQDITQAKFDSGMVIKASVMEAQSETASKETALSQARKSLAVAKSSLKSLTGSVALPAAIDQATYQGAMDRLMEMSDADSAAMAATLSAAAAANNPDLAAASIAAEAATKEIEQARAGYSPTIAAAWSHTASFSAASGFDPASGGAITLSLSVPLDFLAVNAAVQTKSVASAKSILASQAASESLELEIESDLYGLVSSANSVSSSAKALDCAESNYASKLELFKLSRASSSDLSDAQLLVSSSRSALISARYTFLKGLSALRCLVGMEEEDLFLSLVR